MSRVHDAMRNLEHRSAPEKGSVTAPSSLVGALIGELAHEVPDDPSLEGVRADLLAVSRSYESDKKKDLALRFFLALRSLLRAHQKLQERLRKAETNRAQIEVRPLEPEADPHSDLAGRHA